MFNAGGIAASIKTALLLLINKKGKTIKINEKEKMEQGSKIAQEMSEELKNAMKKQRFNAPLIIGQCGSNKSWTCIKPSELEHKEKTNYNPHILLSYDVKPDEDADADVISNNVMPFVKKIL